MLNVMIHTVKENNMKKIDEKIQSFFENKRNLILIFILVISIIALISRYFMLSFKSWDYENCLLEWVKEIRKSGGLSSLAKEIGNYNIPYMTFLTIISYIPKNPLIPIKLLSITFDFLCAIYSALIVGKLIKKNKHLIMAITYTLVLFLPTVLLNGALWAQCDIIYTAFTIASLYYMLEEKTLLSFILLGLAFASKLQFIFILPLYIILYFRKKNFSILNFLIIPIVNFITCLPAIIAGRSIKDCLLIYFAQTGQSNEHLTNNFPNIYRFIPDILGKQQGKIYMMLTIVILGLLTFYIIYRKCKLRNKDIISIGIISIIIMTQLLPYIHERYALCAEVLILIYVIINKKGYHLLITSQLAVLTEYFSFLASMNGNYIDICTIAFILSCIIFCYNAIKELKFEKEEVSDA